ncbi:hypothetical protein [Rhizobium laguerreae]|uniref:hypothetical protein n=1 Tax=Rhizobium laguerreae TaxID=1076926 RepID=UPI001C9222F4|nr:hypothetical protein [Rhizobium laguerreae]MBY3557920.1 hypothetical protein [Rhizobium laguerreae]
MKTAFELPLSKRPGKLISEACPAVHTARGYPLADISSFPLRHPAKLLAIRTKACFDRGLPSG